MNSSRLRHLTDRGGSQRNQKYRRPQDRGLTALRRAYFAEAGDVVARYGIRFERIVQHLWDARRIAGRVDVSSVRCIDDLAHACACCDRHGSAVDDLDRLYTRWLVRHSSVGALVGEIESLIIVRRLWAMLRGAEGGRELIIMLRSYTGARPLRFWLLDQLERLIATGVIQCAGGLEVEGGSAQHGQSAVAGAMRRPQPRLRRGNVQRNPPQPAR